MVDVRIGVLGPLLVERDGEPVTVPEGRRRAVLACLAAHAGRPVPPEVLIDAAWGDTLPSEPRSALHTVVSRLRSAVGRDVVVREPGGHRLAIPLDALDARRFEDLCRRAGSLPAAEAAACLGAALGLWRGRAFEEHADLDPVAAEAQRLERLRLDAQEEHAAALVTLGRFEEAAAALDALLDEHPFREHAVALLMTALDRAGRPADALARYQAHRATMADELGLDPAPEVQEVEARILRRDHDDASSGRAGDRSPVEELIDLPRWLDTSSLFVGRDTALSDLVDALAADRTVTVTGIAGVGKSRLAAEALPAVVARLRMPVTVVELASVDPGQVSSAVAGAIGHVVAFDDATRDVLEYLSIESRLLVLDDCEHVLDEVAAFVDVLVRRCPRVRVLATSRHRLGLRSEHVMPLTPLPTADRARADADRPAVDLFVDRMRRQGPSIELDAADLASIAEVCARLDGIPLAIELAASRAATLGIGTVARELDPQGPPAGYLDAAVDWSIRLLSPEQRRLLAHLSVLEGAVSPADITAIGRHLGWWDDDRGGLADLEELVESSLLVVHGSGGDRTLSMLAAVRSVAARELVEAHDERRARRAHTAWVSTVTRQAARDWISGRTAEAGRSLDGVRADAEAALRWALPHDLPLAAGIVGSLKSCLHWQTPGALGDLVLDVARRCAREPDAPWAPVGAGAGALASAERGDLATTRELATAAIAGPPDDRARFLARLGLAVATLHAGEHEEALSWLDGVSDLDALPLGDRVEAQITRGIVQYTCGATDLARDSIAVALVGAGVAGAEAARAFALYAAGEVEAQHDPAAGVDRFRESADAADRIGSSHVSQVARLALYALLVRSDRHDEALDLAVGLLHAARRSAAWPQVWTALRVSAELLASHERLEDAALLLLAADASATAPPLVGADVERYRRLRSHLAGHLGQSVIDGLGDLAASASRAAVVDRATTVLADLRDTAGDGGA